MSNRPLKTYRSAIGGYNEWTLWKSDKARISIKYSRSKRKQDGTYEKEGIWFEPAEIFHFVRIANELLLDADAAANSREETKPEQQPVGLSSSKVADDADDNIPF